jgi:hypothetical protein
MAMIASTILHIVTLHVELNPSLIVVVAVFVACTWPAQPVGRAFSITRGIAPTMVAIPNFHLRHCPNNVLLLI